MGGTPLGGFTDEMRAKGAETKRRKAAEAAAQPPAPPPTEAETPTEVAPEGDGTLLAKLALFLGEKASTKAEEDRKALEAVKVLGQLDPKKHADIFESPEVQTLIERVMEARAQSTDVAPGSYIREGHIVTKRPWQWNDLAEGKVEWVDFMPTETIPVTFQGLTYYFKARQRVRCPKVFVDLVNNRYDEQEFGEKHAAWLMGVPGVRPHRDMVSPYAIAGVRARAMNQSQGEYYKPGAGVIANAVMEVQS